MYRRKLSCFDWWKSDPRLLQVPSKEDKSNKRMIKKFKTKSNAPAENRTRGPTMATLDFTTKPLALDARPCKNIYKPYHSPTTSNNKHKQHHKHRGVISRSSRFFVWGLVQNLSNQKSYGNNVGVLYANLEIPRISAKNRYLLNPSYSLPKPQPHPRDGTWQPSY